jgi:8-oxo-dGTP diphosphatase
MSCWPTPIVETRAKIVNARRGPRFKNSKLAIAQYFPRVHASFVHLNSSIPVFGVRDDSLPQKTRPCAYVVAINAEGLIAAVRETSGRIFLPGGGIEPNESPVEAIHREVREELGCRVQLRAYIGQALRHFAAEGCCQALYATFYAGELGDAVATDHEHELLWVSPDELFHPHHQWAAEKQLAARASREAHV